MINTAEMKFSKIDLPPTPPGRPWCCRVLVHAIVETEEGMLGFLTFDNGMLELYL